MERALAEDARGRVVRAQPDGDGRAVDAVEAVLGEIVAEVESERACEPFVRIMQSADVVYRERNDVAAQMIVAD